MIRLYAILFAFFGLLGNAIAQTPVPDSTRTPSKADSDDDFGDLDDLLSELDEFLDSLLSPRSYFLANISVSTGYFNYKGATLQKIRTETGTIFSPLLGYYHKSGLGLTATGFLVNENSQLNFYQYSLSPSYDYLANRKFATGVSYTRYFSKDSLPFYVSPLQNEVSGYFTYRKSWLRPTLMVNYGWGTREEMRLRLPFIESLRLRRLLDIIQQDHERPVDDFSVTASFLHDFYWLHVFSEKDKIRVTPQIVFTAGTQQFGFNQRGFNYSLSKLNRASLLTSAREFNLDDKKEFNVLSLSGALKAEYGIGKFYIQPQALFDYYFPAERDNFSVLFSLNAGISF